MSDSNIISTPKSAREFFDFVAKYWAVFSIILSAAFAVTVYSTKFITSNNYEFTLIRERGECDKRVQEEINNCKQRETQFYQQQNADLMKGIKAALEGGANGK